MSKELCPHDLAKQLDLFDNSLSVCYDLNANSWQLGDVGVVSAYQILVINHVNSKCILFPVPSLFWGQENEHPCSPLN